MRTEAQCRLTVEALVESVAAGVSHGHHISGAVDALVDDVVAVVVVAVVIVVISVSMSISVATAVTSSSSSSISAGSASPVNV